MAKKTRDLKCVEMQLHMLKNKNHLDSTLKETDSWGSAQIHELELIICITRTLGDCYYLINLKILVEVCNTHDVI